MAPSCSIPLRRRRGLVAPAAGGPGAVAPTPARFYIINAAKLARECRLGARINTVMQMAFFHLTQILPSDVALQQLQDAIARSYSSKGREIVERNWQALVPPAPR